jgi:hypothetical protein
VIVRHESRVYPPQDGEEGHALYSDALFLARANRRMSVRVARSLIGVPGVHYREVKKLSLPACNDRPQVVTFEVIDLAGAKAKPTPLPDAYRLLRIEEIATGKNGRKTYVKIWERKYHAIVQP